MAFRWLLLPHLSVSDNKSGKHTRHKDHPMMLLSKLTKPLSQTALYWREKLKKFWISTEQIPGKFKSTAKHYQNWGLPFLSDVILKVADLLWLPIKAPWQLWKVHFHLFPKAVLELLTAAKIVSCCTHVANSGGCFIFTLRNQTQKSITLWRRSSGFIQFNFWHLTKLG